MKPCFSSGLPIAPHVHTRKGIGVAIGLQQCGATTYLFVMGGAIKGSRPQVLRSAGHSGASDIALVIPLWKMSVFEGCQITLELDSSLSFKKKTELKNKIIENGGIISFIVTKKVS